MTFNPEHDFQDSVFSTWLFFPTVLFIRNGLAGELWNSGQFAVHAVWRRMNAEPQTGMKISEIPIVKYCQPIRKFQKSGAGMTFPSGRRREVWVSGRTFRIPLREEFPKINCPHPVRGNRNPGPLKCWNA